MKPQAYVRPVWSEDRNDLPISGTILATLTLNGKAERYSCENGRWFNAKGHAFNPKRFVQWRVA